MMFDVSTTPLAAVIHDNRYKAVLSLYHYCVLVNLFFEMFNASSLSVAGFIKFLN